MKGNGCQRADLTNNCPSNFFCVFFNEQGRVRSLLPVYILLLVNAFLVDVTETLKKKPNYTRESWTRPLLRLDTISLLPVQSDMQKVSIKPPC
jgi:hypothetical protein